MTDDPIDEDRDKTGWFVIVRSLPDRVMARTGQRVAGWDVLGSILFDDLGVAREFAAKLDHARVYRLEAVGDE